MKIIFSKKCLEYSDWHIESPERVRKAYEILKSKGYEFIEPEPASEEDILKVHTKEHLERIKNGDFYDPDTPAYENIYEYARLAAGGAIKAAKEMGFSLMRPPGHHVGKNGVALGAATLGFCYFNNIAIAVKYLNLPTLIIDIDGHHGNGTQEIFYKDPILKISFHRYDEWPRPFYPGTGKVEEIGEGEGLGFSVNVPLPIGTGDEDYLYAFNEIVPPLIESYKPEIIIHQFGVDAHYQDPLVHLSLTTKAYKEISEITHHLAHKFSNGKYLILGGGGYEPRNVARCWAIMFITISESKIKDLKKYNELFDAPINKERKTKVKEIVEEIKKIIFPLHGINIQ